VDVLFVRLKFKKKLRHQSYGEDEEGS